MALRVFRGMDFCTFSHSFLAFVHSKGVKDQARKRGAQNALESINETCEFCSPNEQRSPSAVMQLFFKLNC